MDLIVVTGYTGSGKSTLATALANKLGATITSFDWVMSALRAFPEVWMHVESPVEHQRSVGWELLSRVAEQQLARGTSAVLDLVARDEPIQRWNELAAQYSAGFYVIECSCSDAAVHLARNSGRTRNIPGWYELSEEDLIRSRSRYRPVTWGNKLLIDSMTPVERNLAEVINYLKKANGEAND
jgi:predicted kinase